MTEWIKAPEEVLTIAEELIEDHYKHLLGVNIGFIFRDEAPNSGGKITLGKASVVPAHMRPYVDFEFMIWLAEDKWHLANDLQKRALVDHELAHCIFKEGNPAMRPHDIEEFNDILERYGLWKADLWAAKTAMHTALQISLPLFEPDSEVSVPLSPRVRAIEPSLMER